MTASSGMGVNSSSHSFSLLPTSRTEKRFGEAGSMFIMVERAGWVCDLDPDSFHYSHTQPLFLWRLLPDYVQNMNADDRGGSISPRITALFPQRYKLPLRRGGPRRGAWRTTSASFDFVNWCLSYSVVAAGGKVLHTG